MNDATASTTGEVAIIGLSARFAAAEDVEAFWHTLCTGTECITSFPSPPRHPHFVSAKGVLKGIDRFDAAFFNITPGEAQILDPQHRLFLECAWEAIENAGYDVDRIVARVGVFAGSGNTGYADRFGSRVRSNDLRRFASHIGNDPDHLATRVSYKLNLTGPSITVQTACSTSLVAVCLGCQSLTTYQSDMVLAGGVSIDVSGIEGYEYHENGIVSPDGHCRAFDARAEGTVPGSGVGVVVLKRLEDARADGDWIHAVIKGWALNNDGSSKSSYTAPSVRAQAEVISEALAVAGVHPRSIGLVEAHGTGTRLGDVIEVAALTRAFAVPARRTNAVAKGRSDIARWDQ